MHRSMVFTGARRAHEISMKPYFERPCTLEIVVFSIMILIRFKPGQAICASLSRWRSIPRSPHKVLQYFSFLAGLQVVMH